MSRRTVRAIRQADGRLELLEPVELPKDQVFTVTIDLPDEARSGAAAAELESRRLGAPKAEITRDLIYADLAR